MRLCTGFRARPIYCCLCRQALALFPVAYDDREEERVVHGRCAICRNKQRDGELLSQEQFAFLLMK